MNTFVQMTVVTGDAKFRNQNGKFEVLYCRWEDMKSFVEELLETDEAMKSPTTVQFHLIQTDQDFETWCLEHEILTDDY